MDLIFLIVVLGVLLGNSAIAAVYLHSDAVRGNIDATAALVGLAAILVLAIILSGVAYELINTAFN